MKKRLTGHLGLSFRNTLVHGLFLHQTSHLHVVCWDLGWVGVDGGKVVPCHSQSHRSCFLLHILHPAASFFRDCVQNHTIQRHVLVDSNQHHERGSHLDFSNAHSCNLKRIILFYLYNYHVVFYVVQDLFLNEILLIWHFGLFPFWLPFWSPKLNTMTFNYLMIMVLLGFNSRERSKNNLIYFFSNQPFMFRPHLTQCYFIVSVLYSNHTNYEISVSWQYRKQILSYSVQCVGRRSN